MYKYFFKLEKQNKYTPFKTINIHKISTVNSCAIIKQT